MIRESRKGRQPKDRNGAGGSKQKLLLIAYIFCYFLVSFSFLTSFPFVHSDESWLSGLTRNMMESGSLGVTETFYDLKPRYPHAIKTIFHLLQMPMMKLFGYRIFSFRLLSLIFGCIALVLFYLLLKRIFSASRYGASRWYPLAGAVLLSSDIQFIYASHFARQEIILVCCIIACVLAVMAKRPAIAALVTGLSIGLHPNSFLIGAMCAAMLFPFRPRESIRNAGDRGHNVRNDVPRREWKPLLKYAAITSAFAAFFISLSLSFDGDFFHHYLEYGNSEFDIAAPVTSKLMELPYFFQKIWYGVSGTYYVPGVRFELVLFGLSAFVLAVLLSLGKLKYRSETVLIGKGIAGMLLGMVLIGRYNQTSIVFLFPLFFLLVLLAAANLAEGAVRVGLIAVLILTVASLSAIQVAPWLKFSYDDYLHEIAKAVSPDSKVLANLNCEYYFENGKLLDYRNLSYLKQEGMSVEEYVRKNKIEYIILSDEMDLIYGQRPIWNMIYGNPRYMNELHRFLEERCVPVRQFRNDLYGVRIVQYINSGRAFTVQIFKVKDLS
ncbi:MAG TPA: 4-amino-4-deoxy-L-arabinose transferase [Bacillota bacterium]|nr:4-amino-4-deoxy-L-arabinose transferase [Bacillota bacterium]